MENSDRVEAPEYREIPKKNIIIALVVAALLAIVTVTIIKVSSSNITTSEYPVADAGYRTIGQTATAGTFDLAITSMSEIKHTNYKLVTYKGTIENITNSPQTALISTFKLEDDLGKMYNPSFQTTLAQLDVNPGLVKEGSVVFEVPLTAENFTLTFDPTGNDAVYFHKKGRP